jgi:hypothetical protein
MPDEQRSEDMEREGEGQVRRGRAEEAQPEGHTFRHDPAEEPEAEAHMRKQSAPAEEPETEAHSKRTS